MATRNPGDKDDFESTNKPKDVDARTEYLSASETRDHRDRVMDLALRLLEEEGTNNGGKSLLEITADPARNPTFQEALKRADTMLRMAHQRNYDVHAYQLFEEGEVLSAHAIATRFKEVEWKDFTRNTTATFFSTLREQMRTYADRLADRIPSIEESKTEKAIHRIVAALDHLSEDHAVRASIPAFPEKASEFLAGVISPHASLTDHELKELTFRHLSFIDWCFIEDNENNKMVTRYRPHEIFRFAAARGWEAPRLTKTLSDLADNFVPFSPQRPLSKFEIFDKESPLPF